MTQYSTSDEAHLGKLFVMLGPEVVVELKEFLPLQPELLF